MPAAARQARPRRNDLAEIHIAAKALGMDPDHKAETTEYRQMLFTIARVRSAAELDHAGRAKVVAHLRQLLKFRGMAPWKGHPGKPRQPAPDREALMGKIEALLADAGRPWAYAEEVCKRVAKVDALQFADPVMLGKVVAALMYDQQRRVKRMQAEVFGKADGGQS